MGLFSSQDTVRYGALIDIGSGSVLVSIIKSDAQKTYPEVIWAKREYVPLRSITSVNESAKHVMTSLVNALMLLDSEGRKVFREATGKSKLPEAQVTIAAPWSYTITKNITYAHEEPFTLSEELVNELLRTAHQKVEEDIVENERRNELGLSVVSRSLIGLTANGYPIKEITEQEVKSLRVIEANAVVQDYLVNVLTEALDKVLAESSVSLYSFILIYYYIFKELHTDTVEYCLVDITYEATEIGVVRDGALTYTTHAPFGSFSLAREIAHITGAPLEEAYGYLHHEDPLTIMMNQTPEKIADIKELFRQYEVRISSLFHETGDTLAIPKKIFLHGNLETEKFFVERIREAAKLATSTSHAVYAASGEIIKQQYTPEVIKDLKLRNIDTALLISAQFFHTTAFHKKFEQL